MSENVHKTLAEAGEIRETARHRDRITSVALAVVAVLAALGTLLAHHRSISALTAKNEAILAQARASDAYGKYEAKQVRYQVAQVLVVSNLIRSEESRRALSTLAQDERTSSQSLLRRAQWLEADSETNDRHSEEVLKSYEMLQFSTTFFDIGVVLISISTLVRTRALLGAGGTFGAIGIVLLLVGYFRA